MYFFTDQWEIYTDRVCVLDTVVAPEEPLKSRDFRNSYGPEPSVYPVDSSSGHPL